LVHQDATLSLPLSGTTFDLILSKAILILALPLELPWNPTDLPSDVGVYSIDVHSRVGRYSIDVDIGLSRCSIDIHGDVVDIHSHVDRGRCNRFPIGVHSTGGRRGN
jgi:hypothetical protein